MTRRPASARLFAALAMTSALFGVIAAVPAAAQSDAASAPPAAAPARAPHSPAECVVWLRELSFASSVERHDAAAFAEHLHAGAVFNAGSNRPHRGRERIVQAWAPIVEGKEFVLRWRPGVVHIGGDPAIALSRGPFYSEDLTEPPASRWHVGHFHSVWVRDAAGVWKILFDGPDGAPRAVANLGEAQAFLAAQSLDDCSGR